MEYAVAVFSIRTDTLQFGNYLKRFGIENSIVETPRNASASCGISIRFNLSKVNKVLELVRQSKLSSFVGIYVVNNNLVRKIF